MTPSVRNRLLASLFALLLGLSILCGQMQRAAADSPAAAAPSTIPASKPATNPLTRMAKQALERQKRKQLADLMQKSIKLMEAKKLDEAEKVLLAALVIDPLQETNLYNLACLKALTGHKDEAFKFLDQSANAGFTDFIHIEKDSDLDSLHEDPRWAAFLGKKSDYQHHAAEAAVKSLKEQFGQGYLYEIDDADKLIFATNTDRATLDALKNNLVRQAHSQWKMLFEHKPDQYIAVVVPSPRDYRKIVQMPGVEGFYNHDARTLIASGLGFVTTHEFTHAMHAADLDPLGQEHPIWLVEGMATMFEATEWQKQPDGSELLVPRDNSRLGDLQRAARQKRLIPLDKMFKMEQREFVSPDNALLCYAESGSVMFYLYDTGLLRKFYDTFKETYAQDKTSKLALEKVTGKPLAEFEKDWKAWMLKRTAPRLQPTTDGPFLGIRFGAANDGMLVLTLVNGGPAQKAGFHVGDVIIGLNGSETRDETTFLPTLASHKPGETVVFKIRRSGQYMDLGMVLGQRNDPHTGGAATKPYSSMRQQVE